MGKDHKSKHKKDRKRRRSSSSSSSEDEHSKQLERRLEKERLHKKEEKRRLKEESKANETPEEKKIRRMQKKMKKEAKRRAADAEDTLIPPELNYTNLNNPFNDTKLTETFIWGKKLEKEGKSGLTQEELTRQTSHRIRKNLTEAAEFKRIRDSRAAQKEDLEMMKRDADLRAGQMSDSKEREFQLDQIKERSRIRIDQGRAKAIDLLTRYSRFADENPFTSASPDFQLENPMKYLKTACDTIDDLEDLIEDIKTFRELEGWAKNETWWIDITRIAEDEIQKKIASNRRDVHVSVQQDIQNLVKDKTVDELVSLERNIEAKLRSNNGNKGYWQDVDNQLKVFIARKRISENHSRVLRLQLDKIREEQKREIQASQSQQVSVEEVPIMKKFKIEEEKEEEEEDDEEKLSKKVRRKVDVQVLDDPELDEQERERKWRALTEDQLDDATLELYRIGSYSPPYNSFDDTMPGIEVIDAQADVEILMERRNRNRGDLPSGASGAGTSASRAPTPDSRMLAIARQGMEGDESMFSVEEQLETQKHLWSDKYRPRKPTYLNRVQTGFDWNKYNQTHYDQDNPPPKIVQGYKFNIFYPDLLDVTKTPTFNVTACEDADFAVIRFTSGPPYEDIAFKVVNREWETLHKNGYKCQFQNGVFQLWFMFKKYRYRR